MHFPRERCCWDLLFRKGRLVFRHAYQRRIVLDIKQQTAGVCWDELPNLKLQRSLVHYFPMGGESCKSVTKLLRAGGGRLFVVHEKGKIMACRS